ncbi:MAG TPA: hypothetical protein VNO70_19465 [Blastocatellia bacterium]|nr:hypothetical protein [Blastocatellia bacterium]
MQILRALAVACLILTHAFAQDPLKVAPQAYKFQFENEWVKIVRVHYAPHAKIPAHDHTKMAAAYVYLNDSGPVIFKHIGLEYGAITRPATKAGSFRLYRAVQEVHEVENPNDTPSDFLRVELKTEPVNERSLRGRYFREDYPAGENYQKVQFENEQLRVTRLVCAPGRKLEVTTNATEPALLIALTPARFKAAGQKGKAARWNPEAGQTRWVALNQQEQLENLHDAPAELLRFDFKTKPVRQDSGGKGKSHDHPRN